MEQADAIESIVPWDEKMELEWCRQITGTASPTIARIPLNSTADARGKKLWLIVRRSLCMVIAGFDEHFGIETKKR